MLRQLRKARGLTLQEAAPLHNLSTASLSRRERGEDKLDRTDIRAAITAYQLTAWQTDRLWTAAGYLPDPSSNATEEFDTYAFAEILLSNLPFPAFVMDPIGYILAWNHGLEALWHVHQNGWAKPHIVGDLFSEQARAIMQDGWDAYVRQALVHFHHRTLRVANEPALQALLADLEAEYGDLFVDRWHEAQRKVQMEDVPFPLEMGRTFVRYESEFGPIEYLVMKSTFTAPTEQQLFMYVPFGTENEDRFVRFRASMGESRLYFAE
jgi:transcriptional regulator with XRE-family HTH domain